VNVTVFWDVGQCRAVEIQRHLLYITTFFFSISWNNERGFVKCPYIRDRLQSGTSQKTATTLSF
jgi:hypothetical protein